MINMRWGLIVKVITVLMLMAFTMTLSVGISGAGEVNPRHGGTLTLGLSRPLDSLAYYRSYAATKNLVTMAIWDTLLQYDEQGNLLPDLAKSWEVPDPKTIVLHLREGVKFHDGNIMDAEDVVASMNFAISPEAKSPMAWMFDSMESVEALDDMTVQINLKTPTVVDVLYALATGEGGVTSKEAIEKYGIGLGEHPIGAGPFKLEKWEKGSRIVLAKFDDYWEEGKPYLDKYVIKILPEEFTRLTALTSRRIHMAYRMSYKDIESLEEMEGFNANVYPTYCIYYLALKNNRAPFNDMRVRKALNYAIDKEALTKAVLLGYAIPAITDIPPSMPGSLAGIEAPYPYDPEKAKELLEEAGYPNGFSFEAILKSKSPDLETGLVLQKYFKAIGVNLKLIKEEPGTHWIHEQAGAYKEAALGYWYPDFPDAAGSLRAFYYSKNIPPKACCNFDYYVNKEVDKLLDKAAQSDIEKRSKLYVEVNKVLYNDAPKVWLYHVQEALPALVKVKGFKLGPMSSFQHIMRDIWLEE